MNLVVISRMHFSGETVRYQKIVETMYLGEVAILDGLLFRRVANDLVEVEKEVAGVNRVMKELTIMKMRISKKEKYLEEKSLANRNWSGVTKSYVSVKRAFDLCKYSDLLMKYRSDYVCRRTNILRELLEQPFEGV